MKDLVGKKFDRLLVIKLDRKEATNYYWICRCTCGKKKSIRGSNLKNGKSKSCGCLQKELLSDRAINPEERFWPKVNKNGSVPSHKPELGKCWIWLAAQDGHGYGVFGLNGSSHKAYRVSYKWLKGNIPTNMQLDHLCRNRICVNPEHLEIVTQIENLRRGIYDRLNGKCSKGVHDMTEDNVYINPTTGKSRCRACRNEYRRKYYLEKHDNRILKSAKLQV
jgi:hypothetical protein